MQSWLEDANIKSKVILDSAVGQVILLYWKCMKYAVPDRFLMEKVDLVIVGAEGVVESGGIINKVRLRKWTNCEITQFKVQGYVVSVQVKFFTSNQDFFNIITIWFSWFTVYHF